MEEHKRWDGVAISHARVTYLLCRRCLLFRHARQHSQLGHHSRHEIPSFVHALAATACAVDVMHSNDRSPEA